MHACHQVRRQGKWRWCRLLEAHWQRCRFCVLYCWKSWRCGTWHSALACTAWRWHAHLRPASLLRSALMFSYHLMFVAFVEQTVLLPTADIICTSVPLAVLLAHCAVCSPRPHLTIWTESWHIVYSCSGNVHNNLVFLFIFVFDLGADGQMDIQMHKIINVVF